VPAPALRAPSQPGGAALGEGELSSPSFGRKGSQRIKFASSVLGDDDEEGQGSGSGGAGKGGGAGAQGASGRWASLLGFGGGDGNSSLRSGRDSSGSGVSRIGALAGHPGGGSLAHLKAMQVQHSQRQAGGATAASASGRRQATSGAHPDTNQPGSPR
jgi:hypothetical protein